MRHETRTAGGTTLAVLFADTPSAEVRGRAEELLAEHGAVLVRGLGLTDAEAFHAAVSIFGESLIGSYRGGNTPGRPSPTVCSPPPSTPPASTSPSTTRCRTPPRGPPGCSSAA
ncbi:hypothetical protein ACU4GG_42795 [Streptomyces nojiriensis]